MGSEREERSAEHCLRRGTRVGENSSSKQGEKEKRAKAWPTGGSQIHPGQKQKQLDGEPERYEHYDQQTTSIIN
jgi:hypothetical protein